MYLNINFPNSLRALYYKMGEYDKHFYKNAFLWGQFSESLEDLKIVPDHWHIYGVSPYLLNNEGEQIIWIILLWILVLTNIIIFSFKTNLKTKDEPTFWESMYLKASGTLLFNFALLVTISHLFYLLFFSFVNFLLNPRD